MKFILGLLLSTFCSSALSLNLRSGDFSGQTSSDLACGLRVSRDSSGYNVQFQTSDKNRNNDITESITFTQNDIVKVNDTSFTVEYSESCQWDDGNVFCDDMYKKSVLTFNTVEGQLQSVQWQKKRAGKGLSFPMNLLIGSWTLRQATCHL